MPLAYRTRFYDDGEVSALQTKQLGKFDWFAVLRAQSCFEPGSLIARRYRTEREKLMVDPSENEVKALLAASPAGGAFLERLGKTDMAKMTEDEWMCFLEVVISAFQDKIAELHSPFGVNRSKDDPITAGEVPF